MKGPNRPPRVTMSADEWDVTSKRWRRMLNRMKRPGLASSIKRGLRRKVRRTQKRDIEEQEER